jgi:hypothetical protein
VVRPQGRGHHCDHAQNPQHTCPALSPLVFEGIARAPFGRIGGLTSTIRIPPEHYSRLSSDRIRYVQPRSARLSNVRVDVYADLCRIHSRAARFFAAKTLAGLSHLPVAPFVPSVEPRAPPFFVGRLVD